MIDEKIAYHLLLARARVASIIEAPCNTRRAKNSSFCPFSIYLVLGANNTSYEKYEESEKRTTADRQTVISGPGDYCNSRRGIERKKVLPDVTVILDGPFRK